MREKVLFPFKRPVKGMTATAGGTAARIMNPFRIASSLMRRKFNPRIKPPSTT
jgi:hypothetical protein